MRILLALFIAFGLAACATPEENLNKGLEAYKNSNYDEAAKYFKKACNGGEQKGCNAHEALIQEQKDKAFIKNIAGAVCTKKGRNMFGAPLTITLSVSGSGRITPSSYSSDSEMQSIMSDLQTFNYMYGKPKDESYKFIKALSNNKAVYYDNEDGDYNVIYYGGGTLVFGPSSSSAESVSADFNTQSDSAYMCRKN